MKEINENIYFYPKEKSKGILKYPKCQIEVEAYIGKNGLTKNKQEGDKKTPIGEFELGIILNMHKNGINKNNMQYTKITDNMYWVDDVNSKYYNQLVNIQEVEREFKSAEHLIEYKTQYEYLIEIKTNPNNIPNKGSAIFLHCTNSIPTAGCISINSQAMKEIISNISKNAKIVICEMEKL